MLMDQPCETPGCKNRGLKYLRDDKFLCRKCARIYDGKDPYGSEETKDVEKDQ